METREGPGANPAPRRHRAPAELPAWLRLLREETVLPEHALIREPSDLVRVVKARLQREQVEVFVVVCLNSQSRVIACTEVSRGLLNSTLVAPREVFQLAIVRMAAGIILAHNHPSGDPTPSAEDRAVTGQMVTAGRLLDIPVYDHVIIGRGDTFASFATLGLM